MIAELALVLGLVASAPGSPPPTTAGTATTPPGRSWVLVQADGTRVTFEGPPENRDGRFVGRLKGSGTLVSIPAVRVDTEATGRANAPGAAAAAAAAAAPKVRPTPGPFATPPLGDRVRMKTSGDEARRILENARMGTPEPPPPPGTTPTAAPVPAEKPPTDNLGRGEDYWRERAGAARGVFDDAERDLAAAEAQLAAAERSYLGVGEAERNSYVIRVIEARDVAEKARAQHRSASGRWEALQEEARKAGAFPGWLR
ncbi:MAG: hypothetical protein IPN03_02455 [Holophagales bacterium]|nr:hypothetical protein [Holophagales bacterium]